MASEDIDDKWVAPFGADEDDSRSLAPFASTPDARIIEMIELAKVNENDIVADLGAGDGIVLKLVWKYSKAKKAVGYEINKELVEEARNNLRESGCPSSYLIEDCDVMSVDISSFTVIFTWLQPWAVDMLGPKLKDAIRDHGCRVVSYQWPIDELSQAFKTTVGKTNNMYLYEPL